MKNTTSKPYFIRTFAGEMLSDFLTDKRKEELPFEANEQQSELLNALGAFIISKEPHKCFVLHGYAGTGKTSLISGLVRALVKLKQKPVLMAPTGRAAKVLSLYSGFPAYTIHKTIYRQKSMAEYAFDLDKNLFKNRIFIIDESSMISDTSFDKTCGSGSLLDDLIRYVYSGENCSLLLLGDSAQLPPVEQRLSPALCKDFLENFGLSVHYFSLTEVVRQTLESGILSQATALRTSLTDNIHFQHPEFRINDFADIERLNGSDLIEKIEQCYRHDGTEETIIITRSNKRANLYNNGIRNSVMMREAEVANGDLLMVTKNNYFWNKEYDEIDFIANGEALEIRRINHYNDMYGFRFADMTLRSLDYEWELDAKVLIDSLQAENPAHQNKMHQDLLQKVAEDYPEITNRKKLFKKIFESEYYNALQVKFAYAITCHKAQGGQWKNVFIDYSFVPNEQLNEDYYRWLYTAITRATQRVFLVNFPKEWFT